MNWLVIMAGGVGERFWPMSRRRRPKQLLPIVSDRTMIQETARRLAPLFDWSRMLVVTNREQAAAVRKQLPRVKHVIAEPVGRNTAPCIGVAAAVVAHHDPNGVMAVVPADSWIGDVARYQRVMRESLAFAKRSNVLITVGIKPSAPHTGYGYVQLGKPVSRRFWKARRFVEKPNLATAEKYVVSGKYRWNAGTFVWSVKSIQAALAVHHPSIAAACGRVQATVGSTRFNRALAREYSTMEKISIDYAVMEKAGNVVVANGDFPWDDVGDWAALGKHLAGDRAGNRVRGDVITLDSRGCVVVGPPDQLIATVGLEDVVIVQTADATLVCRKDQTQRIKELVQQLAATKRTKLL